MKPFNKIKDIELFSKTSAKDKMLDSLLIDDEGATPKKHCSWDHSRRRAVSSLGTIIAINSIMARSFYHPLAVSRLSSPRTAAPPVFRFPWSKATNAEGHDFLLSLYSTKTQRFRWKDPKAILSVTNGIFAYSLQFERFQISFYLLVIEKCNPVREIENCRTRTPLRKVQILFLRCSSIMINGTPLFS